MKNAPSIIDVKEQFETTEACVRYLEAMRWPEGIRCLVCGGEKISKFVTNEANSFDSRVKEFHTNGALNES
jgi:hypothetical protein